MRLWFTLVAFLFSLFCFAQNDSVPKFQTIKVDSSEKYLAFTDPVRPVFFQPAFSFDKKRTVAVVGTETVLSTGSLIALNQIWYKQYPKTSFHFFNDNGEWLQMDKCGHAVTSYTIGRYGMRLLEWGGVERKKAIWFGGLTGLAYQSVLEMFDGFSSGWGFSSGDIYANAIGSGFLIGQEYLWKEQRISLKFGFHKSGYAQYRPELLGKNFHEQVLKDYNGQTYWASINIASFMNEETKFPKWINVAVGYGADGMTGGHFNPVMTNSSGNIISFERYRQYYLSLDIDLTKIPTDNYFLKTIFETIGFLKIPAPGLELAQGKIYGKWLVY
jgi:hypothetical protein